MFDSIGYYLLFLFKTSLSLVLSLIFYSLYKKNGKVSLKFYSMIAIIITTLVSISYNIDLQEEHSRFFLPAMILFLVVILSAFMGLKPYEEEDFLHYFLVISVSIAIGLGYYFSSITLSILIYIIHYSFDGVLKFFSNNEDEDLINIDNIDSLDLKDDKEFLESQEENK